MGKLVEKGGGKLSQLRLAANFVRQIEEHFDDPELDCEGSPLNGLYRLQQRLSEVLGKAQNRPPQGASDGSIDETHFAKLREVERCAQSLIWAVDAYKRLT